MSAIHFSHVSFSYSSALPIISDTTFDLGPGWCGLVGANGVGKSTLLALAADELAPDTGSVWREPAGSPPVLVSQRVENCSAAIQHFGAALTRDAVRMRARLRIHVEQLDRWSTLSPGERKCWQVGAALVSRPDVLLLDEPTNHLDARGRDLLVESLHDFDGCGVIVSHDRTLLNDLTTRTLEMARATVEVWNGPYDTARAAWKSRATQRQTQYETLRAQERKLRRRLDIQHRKSVQKDAQRQRTRRAAVKRDLDARGSSASYRHERGQKTGAKTVSNIKNSLQSVAESIADSPVDEDRSGVIGFGFEPAPKELLARYHGPVLAGGTPLFSVDVSVGRSDRIRIAGDNGVGKTSLLTHLVATASVPKNRLLYLEQETSANQACRWMEELEALDPAAMGHVMSLVSRLGSDPAALLASDQPSPGEARKIALAIGLGTPTWMLILDEPTNHLDLPAIERLEAALLDYRGALLLVSHDERLAARVTSATWTITQTGLVLVN